MLPTGRTLGYLVGEVRALRANIEHAVHTAVLFLDETDETTFFDSFPVLSTGKLSVYNIITIDITVLSTYK